MDDEEIRARAAALLAGDLPDDKALASVVALLHGGPPLRHADPGPGRLTQALAG